MTLKPLILHAWGLSLVFLLGAASPGGKADPTPRGTSGELPAMDEVVPDGKEAVTAALKRVRRTGSFNHPDYPWVVRARRVQGDTIYFVEFLHRRKDGKGFDRVGKAVQVTLTFSPVYQPFDIEPKPPVRRDTLRVHVGRMNIYTEGEEAFCVDKTFDLPLPGRLRPSAFRPYAEARDAISAEQRKALVEEYPLSPQQKRLLTAFGEKAVVWFRGEIMMSHSGRTVVAWDGLKLKGSRYQLDWIAVARFDKNGAVVQRYHAKNVSGERRAVYRLLLADESQTITLHGADGKKFVLPAIKAAS